MTTGECTLVLKHLTTMCRVLRVHSPKMSECVSVCMCVLGGEEEFSENLLKQFIIFEKMKFKSVP